MDFEELLDEWDSSECGPNDLERFMANNCGGLSAEELLAFKEQARELKEFDQKNNPPVIQPGREPLLRAGKEYRKYKVEESLGAGGAGTVFAARNSIGERVALKEIELDRRLRTLYAEDSDWNLILRDLTEAAVQAQQEVSDFEEGFTSSPEDITLQSLLPKLSTVVYRTPTNTWEPENIVGFFGEENLLTMPIGLNLDAGVAWCVVEHRSDVRWGDIRTIEEVTYQLYVLYFDAKRMEWRKLRLPRNPTCPTCSN